MPPEGNSSNKDNIYLLMVEFNKTMQTAQAGQNQTLAEIRSLVSSVSERLARMEAQDLGKRIQIVDEDLRAMRDGEIARLRDRLNSLEAAKPDLKPLIDDINSLKNDRIDSKATQRVWLLVASGAGSFIGAAALVLLRLVMTGGGDGG